MKLFPSHPSGEIQIPGNLDRRMIDCKDQNNCSSFTTLTVTTLDLKKTFSKETSKNDCFLVNCTDLTNPFGYEGLADFSLCETTGCFLHQPNYIGVLYKDKHIATRCCMPMQLIHNLAQWERQRRFSPLKTKTHPTCICVQTW